MSNLNEVLDAFSTVLFYRENTQRTNMRNVAFITEVLVHIYSLSPLDVLREVLNTKIEAILLDCDTTRETHEARVLDCIVELSLLAAVYFGSENENEKKIYGKICSLIEKARAFL